MAAIKIQTGLRLDEATYEKLKVVAQRDGRSLNNLIEFVLRQYLAQYEAEHGALPQRQD